MKNCLKLVCQTLDIFDAISVVITYLSLKMRERVFPSISFLAVSAQVKRTFTTLLWSFELRCSLKPAHECPLTGWDKVSAVVKRQYSAICLIKYYKDFHVGYVFAPKKQSHLKYFNAKFLLLSICIYNLYTFPNQLISSPYESPWLFILFALCIR